MDVVQKISVINILVTSYHNITNIFILLILNQGKTSSLLFVIKNFHYLNQILFILLLNWH
jgi:hypothetical protein